MLFVGHYKGKGIDGALRLLLMLAVMLTLL